MPRYEPAIQKDIADAIEFYFMDAQYGRCVRRNDIRICTPAPGGQANEAEAFGRKPFDIGFFALNTVALFFEVKERASNGKIPEFKVGQVRMLETLVRNKVDIQFAYNAWDFDWNTRLSEAEVLEQAHVRAPSEMKENIVNPPMQPAQTLRDYLDGASNTGRGKKLVDVLNSNVEQLDNFNSMPLMILTNLDTQHIKVLIDRAPSGTLAMMKKYFDVDQNNQAKVLADLMFKKNTSHLAPMVNAIFDLKKNWVASNQVRMAP